MSKPEWREVKVTRKQARVMAEAIWNLEQRMMLYREMAYVSNLPSVKDRIALAEIRRRLYVAAGPRDK